MIIFWRFLLSHLLADFTLQFDVVNRLKRKSVYGMLLHCFTHLVVSVGLLYKYLGDVWMDFGFIKVNGWLAVILMLVFHFAVDEIRVYSMNKLGYKDGTISFLLDQVAHVSVLFVISPVYPLDASFFLPEKWVGLVSIFVIITHATTVLIYFIEKDLKQTRFPDFDEKYFLIFERVVLWAFFFVPGNWWIPFMLAWIFQIFYVKRKRIIDLSMTNISLSVIITLLCGIWARHIYYS
ncbi:MAG: DUF3307 domain-containing protein [Elusimicrobia bacterium]|nr:DUF3307 domain-containing protein [Elusimicrobiota bacterium]